MQGKSVYQLRHAGYSFCCPMMGEEEQGWPGSRCTGLAGWAVPVQGGEEAAWAEQQRPLWQHCAPLVDPMQIAPRHVCHPDGTCRTIEKLVAIPKRYKMDTLNSIMG